MADLAVQAKAQNVNAVTKFETNLQELLAVLGKSDVNVMPNGQAINIYKSSGTLVTQQVAEGAAITPSEYAMTIAKTVTLTFSKYLKYTGIESIQTKGYDIAVGGTNDAMLRDVQKAVRTAIYDGIKTGTGTGAAGATFQAACANAWAALNAKFEDEAATPVFFANHKDAAAYLGAANITVQTAFGMSYIENFLGLGNVLLDSNVPEGKIIATATENIDICAANVAAIPGLDCYTDRSGIIAVHNGAAYDHAAIETAVYCGLEAFPVFLDRVIKVDISSS